MVERGCASCAEEDEGGLESLAQIFLLMVSGYPLRFIWTSLCGCLYQQHFTAVHNVVVVRRKHQKARSEGIV